MPPFGLINLFGRVKMSDWSRLILLGFIMAAICGIVIYVSLLHPTLS